MAHILHNNPKPQYIDENGDPYSGGKLYHYEAGTSTPLTVYKTAAGTAHSQPIVLNTAGRVPDSEGVFIPGDTAYKEVLKTSADVEVYTIDNLTALAESAVIKSDITALEVINTGSIIAFASETPPTGALECDGSSLLRATYADLFAVIGTVFGTADGTHFNIPDLQGEFLRGWDNSAGNDPDAATRTDAGDGSTTGDHVGTKQADEFESHVHVITRDITGSAGANRNVASVDNTAPLDTAATGGNETRPRNVNMMYCIVY